MQPSVNNIVEICVPLIIILLGTAYPIILNNISNIGEKYHSKYIIALFKYSILCKAVFITGIGISNSKESFNNFDIWLISKLFKL